MKIINNSIFCLFLIIFSNSCFAFDLDGKYVLDSSYDCSIEIVIDREHFYSRVNKSEMRGKLGIVNEDNELYLTFHGLVGSFPESDVKAEYKDSMIFIQNYGNSINDFTVFADCSSKYLILEKDFK